MKQQTNERTNERTNCATLQLRSTVVALLGTSLVGCTTAVDDVHESTDRMNTSLSNALAEEAEQVFFDEAGGVVRAQPAPVTRWFGAPPVEKPQGEIVEAVDVSAEVLRTVEAIPGDELVSLTVTLPEVDTDWGHFAKYRDNDDARAHFVHNRQLLLDDAQRPLLEWLAARGYEGDGYWLANQVLVEVPASMVREVYEREDVIGISLNGEVSEGVAWDGSHSKNATIAARFHADGYDGRAGHRTDGTQRIRVGILEISRLNRDHVGWLGKRVIGNIRFSRINAVWDCSFSPCVSEPITGPSAGGDHGSIVASVAAGSIEDGQDANFPGTNTLAQRARSGHLPESRIYYYWGWGDYGTNVLRRGLDRAVMDGVDVMNISLFAGPNCQNTANYSGINEAISSALNAGMLVVAMAGNGGASKCTVDWPGLRTEVLAANSLNTASTATSYTSTVMASHAARGGLPIRTFQGFSSTTAAIDLAAPSELVHTYSAYNNNQYNGAVQGSSIATPVVTGAVGAMRNSLHGIGWPTQGKTVLVNTLLMGDGWDGNTPAGADRTVGLSDYSGNGRLRIHHLNDLTGPGAWGTRSFTINQGEWVSWPVGWTGALGSTVTQWKWVATWFEPDLQNVADVDFYVVDTCPPGGGQTLVNLDATRDLRARFDLKKAELTGRCLEMRAYGYAVPAGGRQIWSADYYHSGSVDTH